MRSCFVVLMLSLPVLAQEPKVEKLDEWDLITLPSGGAAKVYVPKSAPAEKRGLVMAFHGLGGSPDVILKWGASLAEHRGEVWCAYRGTGNEGGKRTWALGKDQKGIEEMLAFVVKTYGIEPGKAIGFGYQVGAEPALAVCPGDKKTFAGFVTCGGTSVPGEKGGDCTGMRVVVILGTKDPGYQKVDAWRAAIAKAGGGVSLWVNTDLEHTQYADKVWINDAFNAVTNPAHKAGEKTLSLIADHEMSPPGPTKPPEFLHALVAWKNSKAPKEVTRTKLQAKALAEGWFSKIRKGEKKIEDMVAESDHAESKARGGGMELDQFFAFGAKVVDKARAMKPGTAEMFETELGYHVIWKQNPAK